MLLTGDAFNKFLVQLISNQTPTELVNPPNEIISFKETLIIAFQGVLKYRGEINSLESVTGAKKDNIVGLIYDLGIIDV